MPLHSDGLICSENPCHGKYVYTSRPKVFKRYFSKQHEALHKLYRMARCKPESRSLTVIMTSFFSSLILHRAASTID